MKKALSFIMALALSVSTLVPVVSADSEGATPHKVSLVYEDWNYPDSTNNQKINEYVGVTENNGSTGDYLLTGNSGSYGWETGETTTNPWYDARGWVFSNSYTSFAKNINSNTGLNGIKSMTRTQTMRDFETPISVKEDNTIYFKWTTFANVAEEDRFVGIGLGKDGTWRNWGTADAPIALGLVGKKNSSGAVENRLGIRLYNKNCSSSTTVEGTDYVDVVSDAPLAITSGTDTSINRGVYTFVAKLDINKDWRTDGINNIDVSIKAYAYGQDEAFPSSWDLTHSLKQYEWVESEQSGIDGSLKNVRAIMTRYSGQGVWFGPIEMYKEAADITDAELTSYMTRIITTKLPEADTITVDNVGDYTDGAEYIEAEAEALEVNISDYDTDGRYAAYGRAKLEYDEQIEELKNTKVSVVFEDWNYPNAVDGQSIFSDYLAEQEELNGNNRVLANHGLGWKAYTPDTVTYTPGNFWNSSPGWLFTAEWWNFHHNLGGIKGLRGARTGDASVTHRDLETPIKYGEDGVYYFKWSMTADEGENNTFAGVGLGNDNGWNNWGGAKDRPIAFGLLGDSEGNKKLAIRIYDNSDGAGKVANDTVAEDYVDNGLYTYVAKVEIDKDYADDGINNVTVSLKMYNYGEDEAFPTTWDLTASVKQMEWKNSKGIDSSIPRIALLSRRQKNGLNVSFGPVEIYKTAYDATSDEKTAYEAYASEMKTKLLAETDIDYFKASMNTYLDFADTEADADILAKYVELNGNRDTYFDEWVPGTTTATAKLVPIGNSSASGVVIAAVYNGDGSMAECNVKNNVAPSDTAINFTFKNDITGKSVKLFYMDSFGDLNSLAPAKTVQ